MLRGAEAADNMPERDSKFRVTCPFFSEGLGTLGALFWPETGRVVGWVEKGRGDAWSLA